MVTYLILPTLGQLKTWLTNRNQTNKPGGFMTKRMLISLIGITNIGEFQNRRSKAMQAMTWQIIKSAQWRRQNHDFRLYHLVADAVVEIDEVTENLACELQIRQVGGHSGFHAFLYVEGELIIESSHRTDPLVTAEQQSWEQARRDLHSKAQELFGVNLEELYLECFPVNIYKEPSRKAFWISALAAGVTIAILIWLATAK